MSTTAFTVTVRIDVSDELALRSWVESMVSPMYVRGLVDPQTPAHGLLLCAVRAVRVPGVDVTSGAVRAVDAPTLEVGELATDVVRPGPLEPHEPDEPNGPHGAG